MELKHINGRKLIELLNSKEDDVEDLKDETLYYKFEYEEEFIKDNNFILNFTILLSTIKECVALDSDYITRGNRIYIDADGKVDSRLQEPFDSGSQYDEIEDIVKVYLKRLEIDIRDNKINIALGEDTDERSKLNDSIISTLRMHRSLCDTLKDLNTFVSGDSAGDLDLFLLRDLDIKLKDSLTKIQKNLN